jgi:pimeloyl-ACP methyl ester carboxylesterase
LAGNINTDDEVQAKLEAKLDMPVLVITEQPSVLSIPGFAEQMKLVAEDIKFEQVTTEGHWVQLEARDEVNAMLEKFVN